MSELQQRSIATALHYSQGNIGNLSDEMTRRLIASTVQTESAGGNLSVTNAQGYVGRYQAGAAWLADAGLIKGGDSAVVNAMHKAGFKSEWSWAESGGMTKFLNNPDNWNNGLSIEKYKQSADIQDNAFKTVSNHSYDRALKKGYINEGTAPEVVAGYLKARHISGEGGAHLALQGKVGHKDINGTSNMTYFNHIVKNSDGLGQVFHAAYSQSSKSQAASSVATEPTSGKQNLGTKQEPDRTQDPKPVPGAVVTNADHHGAVKHPGVQPTASAHTEHPQTAQATKSHDGLLQHGAHGQEVTDLQTKLKALGAKVQVDGVFGDETLRAVKGYQMMNGLKVDGVYGPNTLAALNTDIARITPQQVHAVTPQPEKAPMTFVDAMKGVTEGQAIASGNTQASIQAPVSPIGDIQVGKVPLTPQDANHPQHKLYESVGKVVQEFEAKNNIPHTQHSEMAVASLTALANKLGMTEVTDFNFDKAKGQFNIGQLNVSPPLVGGMDAGKASITPVQQSFDQMNQLAAVQHREAANEPSLQQQTPPAQEQPKARSM